MVIYQGARVCFAIPAPSAFWLQLCLALWFWQPRMTSWYVCGGPWRSCPGDIAFYQGKLYLVLHNTTDIFSYEFQEDCERVTLTPFQKCLIGPLPSVEDCPTKMCNLVAWRKTLLVVIRYSSDHHDWLNVLKVGVLSQDFSTKPHRFTEMSRLDGNCLFISSSKVSNPVNGIKTRVKVECYTVLIV